MRPKHILLAALILLGCLDCGIANDHDEAHLEARAKIKRVQARKIAMTRVPHGRPAGERDRSGREEN